MSRDSQLRDSAGCSSSGAPFAPPDLSVLAARFPELEILELLGQGGMGAVFKARQRELDRVVALKILPPEAAQDPAFAERFTREARTLARLNHPNIVVIYEFGHKDDLYYLLMEFVEGVNLRQLIRAGKLQPHEALKIVPQICEALQFAHDEGVVHRDIKPENVLLDKKGRVKIADFGIAKMLCRKAGDYTLTGPWQVVGTLHYMAPEQMEKPLAVDHRADIYSLGVVFYEMLTGELPLGRFSPPSKKVQVDVRLDEVVLHAMEREPERRYQHASEVRTDLESIERGAASAPDSGRQVNNIPLRKAVLILIPSFWCVLMIVAGVDLAVYAVMHYPASSGEFWGLFGGAFGCVFGGLGGIFGGWNHFRQLRGARDLLRETKWTWFDTVMASYGIIGLLVGQAGLVFYRLLPSEASYAFLLFAGIMIFQAVVFTVVRFRIRGTANPAPAEAKASVTLSSARTPPSPAPTMPRAASGASGRDSNYGSGRKPNGDRAAISAVPWWRQFIDYLDDHAMNLGLICFFVSGGIEALMESSTFVHIVASTVFGVGIVLFAISIFGISPKFLDEDFRREWGRLQTALAIRDKAVRDEALVGLAGGVAAKGMYKIVLDALAAVHDGEKRDLAAADCALKLAPMEQSEAATQVAMIIRDKSRRDDVLSQLAKYQGKLP
jgi:predicted Ser/Thr protein kinase